jgi:hypothetical protein
MISSFPHFINSQTETLILGTIPGVFSYEARVLRTREIILENYVYPLAVCLSQIYIEK